MATSRRQPLTHASVHATLGLATLSASGSGPDNGAAIEHVLRLFRRAPQLVVYSWDRRGGAPVAAPHAAEPEAGLAVVWFTDSPGFAVTDAIGNGGWRLRFPLRCPMTQRGPHIELLRRPMPGLTREVFEGRLSDSHYGLVGMLPATEDGLELALDVWRADDGWSWEP